MIEFTICSIDTIFVVTNKCPDLMGFVCLFLPFRAPCRTLVPRLRGTILPLQVEAYGVLTTEPPGMSRKATKFKCLRLKLFNIL